MAMIVMRRSANRARVTGFPAPRLLARVLRDHCILLNIRNAVTSKDLLLLQRGKSPPGLGTRRILDLVLCDPDTQCLTADPCPSARHETQVIAELADADQRPIPGRRLQVKVGLHYLADPLRTDQRPLETLAR